MEGSAIAWCDHTHNEWIGCAKVSAGCDHCFAENLMDTRYHRVQWGQRKTETTTPSVGTRALTAPANRRKPFAWQEKAWKFMAEHGRRQRVFCSSLSDIWDNQVPLEWRADLCHTIDETPGLDWLLLTKRPENIIKLAPAAWREKFPSHVWLGTTCEDQAAFDRRWPILREVPAKVRFISYEPAIGPLRLTARNTAGLSWLICGGESGAGFRKMPLVWAADIKGDCGRAGVRFFMKQMSGFKPQEADIPASLMLREFPTAA